MQRSSFCRLLICVSLLASGTPITLARQASGASERQNSGVNERQNEVVDSIQFLKQFHIGMTYDEVQHAFPKTLQQDALAYSTRDGVFMLEVGKPTGGDWSAYLIFDTSDLEIKKPERLIEIDCSSTLPVTDETFESVVRRVSGSFGEPIKLDSTGRTSRAGWQTVGGSLLTVEYTRMVGAEPKTQCVVDFVVRSASRRSKDTVA